MIKKADFLNIANSIYNNYFFSHFGNSPMKSKLYTGTNSGL